MGFLKKLLKKVLDFYADENTLQLDPPEVAMAPGDFVILVERIHTDGVVDAWMIGKKISENIYWFNNW